VEKWEHVAYDYDEDEDDDFGDDDDDDDDMTTRDTKEESTPPMTKPPLQLQEALSQIFAAGIFVQCRSSPGRKDKLRQRTMKLFELLARSTHDSRSPLLHKGFLRALERGPLVSRMRPSFM
jgi:hypothetical protein